MQCCTQCKIWVCSVHTARCELSSTERCEYCIHISCMMLHVMQYEVQSEVHAHCTMQGVSCALQ